LVVGLLVLYIFSLGPNLRFWKEALVHQLV